MGDAGDILRGFLQKPPQSSPLSPRTPDRKKVQKKRYPEGVSREVYELRRDNESEFGQTFGYTEASIVVKKKKKQKSIGIRAEKWEKRSFTSSARSDGLLLHHWEKASSNPKKDYYFTKFNEKVEAISYTEEEYKKYFLSSTWTKEQTDVLIDLCNRFDLRFIIIFDRFTASFPGKTIEDLRDRYYTILRKKLELSAKTKKGMNLADMHPFRFKYNADHEKKRKEQAETMYNRSENEAEEEKKLSLEYKGIETFLKKMNNDKKPKELFDTSLSKRGFPFGDADTPSRKRKRKDDHDVPASSRGRREKGAYVRSGRMQVPLAVGSLSKKVDSALDEFGISRRPIPTAFISKEYNEVRQDIVVLLELQAVTKRKAIELQFYKKQLEIVTRQRQQQEEEAAENGENKGAKMETS